MPCKTLHSRTCSLVAGLASLCSTQAFALELKPAWEATTGFSNPESVVYDPAREVLYVSNVAGPATEPDDVGFISRLGVDGKLIEAEWITGLNAPKGLAVTGDRLYIADITQLHEVDIAAGKLIKSHAAADAPFLNDVTVGPDGTIYVSAFTNNLIYRLKDGEFSAWLEDDALITPNGLLAQDDRLLVAAWGVMTDGFATAVPGHLLTVDYATRKVASLGNGTPVGNLDGLETDGGDGFLVTDWMAGALLRIQPSGEFSQVLDLNQGSADHEVIHELDLMVIPMMQDSTVVAYRRVGP